MTRVAVITRHDGSNQVVNFGKGVTDEYILEYIKINIGNLHAISKVDICSVITEYNNITPIENWLKTTKKLTS